LDQAAANKVLVSRFYEEVWNLGNLEVCDEILSPDYTRHDLRPGNPSGPAGMKKIAGDFRNTFPDIHLAVSFMVAEDNMVVVRWVITGTHTGKWGKIKATGKKAGFSGINIFRFEKGKVAELWNYRDDLGLMEQIGASVHGGATSE
jgi:steroid delta-isomerase-like uncharacterized protein